jgi:uncharacterized RmlC-like cupin family protein
LATELSEAGSQLWRFDSFASLANVTSMQARIPLISVVATDRGGHMNSLSARWRSDGVRIIRPGEFDSNIAQTAGLRRLAAVTTENTGATKLWAGTFAVDAKAKTGPHHHGDLETVIYVLNGVARLRWGERLEFEAEAAAGDFIYVPPYVPHQEINPSPDLQLQCVLARSGEGLVFNLDIEGVETPELVRWIDDLHK